MKSSNKITNSVSLRLILNYRIIYSVSGEYKQLVEVAQAPQFNSHLYVDKIINVSQKRCLVSFVIRPFIEQFVTE